MADEGAKIAAASELCLIMLKFEIYLDLDYFLNHQSGL